jgi:hypothetical protein
VLHLNNIHFSFFISFLIVESISIEVGLRNPLQIPLQLTNLRLWATHSNTLQKEDGFYSNDNEELAEITVKESPFQTPSMDLLLGPSYAKKIQLTILPLKPGCDIYLLIFINFNHRLFFCFLFLSKVI